MRCVAALAERTDPAAAKRASAELCITRDRSSTDPQLLSAAADEEGRSRRLQDLGWAVQRGSLGQALCNARECTAEAPLSEEVRRVPEQEVLAHVQVDQDRQHQSQCQDDDPRDLEEGAGHSSDRAFAHVRVGHRADHGAHVVRRGDVALVLDQAGSGRLPQVAGLHTERPYVSCSSRSRISLTLLGNPLHGIAKEPGRIEVWQDAFHIAPRLVDGNAPVPDPVERGDGGRAAASLGAVHEHLRPLGPEFSDHVRGVRQGPVEVGVRARWVGTRGC